MFWRKKCDMCGSEIKGREYYFRGQYFCSQEHVKVYIESLEKSNPLYSGDSADMCAVDCC